MDVLFYLKEFLNSNKTISIAGLGTLYKKKSPGKYDEQKCTFVPPSYTLSFISEVNELGELANFIAQEEKIDIDFATLQINEFTEKIHSQLTYQQQVTLDGLGKFTLINGEISFSADEENEFGNQFYGLPNLHEITEPIQKTAFIADEQENPTNQKETDTSDSEKELNGINEENKVKYTGKPFTPNYDYDDDANGEMSNSVKILLKTLLVITIIVTIVGLAYFFNPGFFDNIRSNENEISNTESVISIDSVERDDFKINNDSINKSNLDTNIVAKEQPIAIVKPLTKIADSSITTYEVIGSAEKSQKRIDLVINSMKKKGIEAKALDNVPGKLIKISLGSFTDFNLAKKHKDSLRKKLNNPEIYIQTIKPKK